MGDKATFSQNQPPVSQTSGLARASLICGLLGVPIVSVVLGHIARREIIKSQGRKSGKGMALAGLILGYANLIIIVKLTLTGGLAALAESNLREFFRDGQEQAAKTWVNGTGKALVSSFFVRVGSYPKTLSDLKNPPNGIAPFVKRDFDLHDPWGNEYDYKYPGVNNPHSFDLWTTTPEGKVIGNWDDF